MAENKFHDEEDGEQKLIAEVAEFMLADAAYKSDHPEEQLVLITLNRIDRLHAKVTKEDIEAVKQGQRVDVPMCSDQFVLSDDDSLRLMLAVANVRAAQGCKIAASVLRSAKKGSKGASDDHGTKAT